MRGYNSIELNNPHFIADVELEITRIVSKMDVYTGGYDFARILTQYYQGFIDDDTELQQKALRWIRGEYRTKMDARADLGF